MDFAYKNYLLYCTLPSLSILFYSHSITWWLSSTVCQDFYFFLLPRFCQPQITNLFISVFSPISLKSLEARVDVTFSEIPHLSLIKTKCFSVDMQTELELIYYVYPIFAWKIGIKIISIMHICIYIFFFFYWTKYFLLKAFLCLFRCFHRKYQHKFGQLVCFCINILYIKWFFFSFRNYTPLLTEPQQTLVFFSTVSECHIWSNIAWFPCSV